MVYSDDKLKEMSDLEKFGEMLSTIYLEDISKVTNKSIEEIKEIIDSKE